MAHNVSRLFAAAGLVRPRQPIPGPRAPGSCLPFLKSSLRNTTRRTRREFPIRRRIFLGPASPGYGGGRVSRSCTVLRSSASTGWWALRGSLDTRHQRSP
ncbi:hypothetical protein Vretimale_16637 [Volvox reticuliferus]|uniref:Uncharacterized protein n=1 Tax=Volvox reticuliferus TaxID=1737510 RepID=A0A8J4LXI9_9CHLO|nr:hypothetical protein Vretimale_16637 [Volvox reticuliferus]